MRIDSFAHIVPQKYVDAVMKLGNSEFQATVAGTPALTDLDARFQVMDRYPDVVQVLTLGGPAVEEVAGREAAAKVARIANDTMAELVARYPNRFAIAVAALPLTDMDVALAEADRAIEELKFGGVLIYTSTDGRAIDGPEFMPLYEKMSGYDLPVWIHPHRDLIPDYPTEKRSKYTISGMWGWPYETTVAMTRLVFSGVLERYPDLKFITHHCGAMVPFFEQRLVNWYDYVEKCIGLKFGAGLTKPILEYFRMFYNDTAVHGSTAALMCGYAFFGAEHLLFGTDAPYDSQLGERSTRETIRSVEEMDIPDYEKKQIFEGNARKLLRLPL